MPPHQLPNSLLLESLNGAWQNNHFWCYILDGTEVRWTIRRYFVDAFQSIGLGFFAILTPDNLFFCFSGCSMGTFIGVLPGIGSPGTFSTWYSFFASSGFMPIMGVSWGLMWWFYLVSSDTSWKTCFESAPLIFAYVLGPLWEESFRRSLLLSGGDLLVFLSDLSLPSSYSLPFFLSYHRYFHQRRGAE